MTKKLVKRFFPQLHSIKNHPSLKVLGKLIHDPYLWHFNRYSVARAFSTGLFAAFIPLPFQTVLAALLAILFRANLAISVALVWITNPFTMAPIFYFNYKLGSLLLGNSLHHFKFELSYQWFFHEFNQIGKPFLIGSVAVACISALLGNILVRLIWRYFIIKDWQKRRDHRKKPQRPIK